MKNNLSILTSVLALMATPVHSANTPSENTAAPAQAQASNLNKVLNTGGAEVIDPSVVDQKSGNLKLEILRFPEEGYWYVIDVKTERHGRGEVVTDHYRMIMGDDQDEQGPKEITDTLKEMQGELYKVTITHYVQLRK